MRFPILRFIVPVLSGCLVPPLLLAQTGPDLRRDGLFFQQKRREFDAWLGQNGLSGVLTADSVSVSADKAVLFLRPPTSGPDACAALQAAWTDLETRNRDVSGRFFHERLLHKWAFLAEVHDEQAEIVVRCHNPAHFYARVTHQNGRTPVEGTSVRSLATVEISTPAFLGGVNTGDNSALIPGKKLGEVTENARKYLNTWYAAKGTPILWKARVAQPFVAVDEFILEVTHLSHEIVPDGFYEYHRIYVRGLQRGADVELSWEFQGKYGSGILFPPRKNDYKDTETRYKDSLEEYQTRLFKQLVAYLRQ